MSIVTETHIIENDALELCKLWGVAPDGADWNDAMRTVGGDVDDDYGDYEPYDDPAEDADYNAVMNAYESQFGWCE